MKDFTQASIFSYAIDHFVIAITSAEAVVSHAPFHEPGDFLRAQPEGRLIMMAMITFALFAVVLALPGLIAVLMSREVYS